MRIVSVIVPVYKVEPYLHRCVDSILGQTFMDHEPILVDDGSPDNSGEICEEYAVADSRVIVIHQKNGGLSCARNTGIDWAFACSDSEWITFVDSDDWIHKLFLETMILAGEELDSNVVACWYDTVEGGSPCVNGSLLHYSLVNTEKFFVEHYTGGVNAWGKIYKKECFKDIRYPFGRLYEDTFVTHKILFRSETIPVIRQPLYAYYVNPNGITHSTWNAKHLDIIDGYRLMLTYLKKNDFIDAYTYIKKRYLFALTGQVSNIKENRKTAHLSIWLYIKYKMKLQWFLLTNPGYTINDYVGAYTYAFPLFSRFVLKMRAIVSN